ncbi:hypothetical protein JL721_12668 [Aureococcus anophagefferens]|nr:hypothetical protein JL721_12668 [Aureococcus anophagefferens]
MFLADTKISAMLAGNPTPFGVYYTFGNLVAIVGSFFLSGPTAQFNKMTEGSRIVSSAVYRSRWRRRSSSRSTTRCRRRRCSGA